MLKKLLLPLIALFTASAAQAQITISGSSVAATNGTYTSLTNASGAFAKLNTSGTYSTGDNIVITITADVTTEAGTNQLSGSTTIWNSVKIVPSGARTISGSVAGHLITLNGADKVIIDGLNMGGASLTLNNTTTVTTVSSTIRFLNDATNDTVRNCSVTSSSQYSVILFSTGSSTGNDNNTISGNNINSANNNCAALILNSGSSSPADNSNITISNNNLYDFFQVAAQCVGIYVASGGTSWTITGNSIYQTGTRSASNMYPILINGGNGYTISGNYIGGSSALCGGTAWTLGASGVGSIFYGIYLACASGTASSIQGNTIRNISLVTSNAGVFAGIITASGSASYNIGTVTGNVIGSTSVDASSAPSITYSLNTTTGGTVYGIYNQAGGTIAMKNNSVGGIKLTTASANAFISNFYGIYNTNGAAGVDISSNTIGSPTSANSIFNGQGQNTGSNAVSIVGIAQNASVACTVNNNTIANLTYNPTGGTGVSSAVQVIGINCNAGTPASTSLTATGNSIYNLANASNNTGAGGSTSVIGLANTATGGATISQDTVYNLRNTATGAGNYSVFGVFTNGSTTATLSKCFIHSLSAAGSGASSIHGIRLFGGTWTIANNMLRLGINASGTSVTGQYDLQGINAASATATIYHNSVYIGGTGSGSTYTYAINIFNTGSDVRNNIIANRRTNGAGTYNAGLYANSIHDYNLYWADVANGGALARLSTTNYTTLSSLQAAGGDAHSVSSDPQFINATGTAAALNLHISTSAATEVESAGTTGLAITTDVDNDTRCPAGGCPGSAQRPDLGADEGAFVGADLTKPYVQAVVVPSQSSATTGPTISVTITDNGQVATGTGVAPRLYYKRCNDASVINGNTSSTSGFKYVEATNTSSPFTFTPDYSLLPAMPAPGSLISYFVAAQDASGNVGITNGGTFASTPASVALATGNLPASIVSAYAIQFTGGTGYTIGTGGTWPNITGPCGCFAAINGSLSTITSDIGAAVISDLSEDNATQLQGTGGKTLTIQPDAATMRTISGTVGGGSPSATLAGNMIGISGASTVLIDGAFSGSGQYFTFRNTNATGANTYPVIKVSSAVAGATSLILRNSIIESNHNASSTGSVLVSGSGTPAPAVTVSGCDFRDARGGTTGRYLNGLYVSWNGATLYDSANKYYNMYQTGSYIDLAATATVNRNSYYQENTISTANDQNEYPVRVSQTAGGTQYYVTNNYVGGSAPLCGGAAWNNTYNNLLSFHGINGGAGATNKGLISGNTIANIRLAGNSQNADGISTAGAYDILNNTIGDTAAANSIMFTGTGGFTQSFGMYLYYSGATAYSVTGNRVANISCAAAFTGASGAFHGLYFSPGSTTPITIQGNTIKALAATSTSAVSIYGMYLNAGTYTVSGNTIDSISNTGTGASTTYAYTCGILHSGAAAATISGNTVRKLFGTGTGTAVSVKGIWNSGNTPDVIQNNTVTGLTTGSASVVYATAPFAAIDGILTSSTAGGQSISGNTVSNLKANHPTSANQVAGIQFGTGTITALTGGTVSGNKVWGLNAASSNSAQLSGILMSNGGNSTTAATVANNFVAITGDLSPGDPIIAGIRDLGASTLYTNYYFNSAAIGGTAGGSVNSYAFKRDGVATNVNVKNNIFQNLRTGGTGNHLAIGNTAGTPSSGWGQRRFRLQRPLQRQYLHGRRVGQWQHL